MSSISLIFVKDIMVVSFDLQEKGFHLDVESYVLTGASVFTRKSTIDHHH